MPEQVYTASKARSGRPGWSVSFRHPLRTDSRGRPGLKIRRGLGTDNDDKAEEMVAELNTILADQRWWSALKRDEAAKRFSPEVVDAFYDEIQAGRPDPEALREAAVPMPDRQTDYSRVLFVGTTGAGKTSLLRQFIGSDPDDDRFPSTAPAKTTISDIEVILAAGAFDAAVTFFSEIQVQSSIEECITDACIAAFEKAPQEKIADRLLNHRDQKFRLGYILGAWRDGTDHAANDEMMFDEEATPAEGLNDGELAPEEKARNRVRLEHYVDRIAALTNAVVEQFGADMGVKLDSASPADREAAEQLIEENFEAGLNAKETFHELVHDILDDVRTRFELVNAGDLRKQRSGWPELWTIKLEDRDEFIRHIRWFSSNYGPQFGRLLTPLVSGIRVRGPLYPEFLEGEPKLVLIDGQGLGHTPDSSSSVTTHVTGRFMSVDTILLVDNAKQPMQAAPLSVLRAVAAGGHHEKLAIAFTHFDQIRGQSLRSFADQRAHVMASVLNALSGLRDVLGAPVVRAIEHGLDQRCFMLGGVDRAVSKLPARAAEYMKGQLEELVHLFEQAILPAPRPVASPNYDPTGIAFAVQEAVTKFQGPWLARLGRGTYAGVYKEHWTRIKALNRRIAGETDIEYDTLRPVADLLARLTEAVSRYLDRPISWKHAATDEQEEQAVIAQIRRGAAAALQELTARRMIEKHLAVWRDAYLYRGTGSADRRAGAVLEIYRDAAPMPDAVMTTGAASFLGDVRNIVVSAINASGGNVLLSEAV